MTKVMRRAGELVLMLTLAACGGGGGGGGGGTSTPGTSGGTSDGAIGTSSSLAQQCAAGNTLAPTNRRTATLDTEKRWLRAYMDEAYLWRDEVPSLNAGETRFSGSDVYTAMDTYFEALKTPQLTDSGARRDKFSFTYPTAEWTALIDGGTELSYGIEWNLASTTPPRRVRIAYVEPGSPAATAGLMRGDELVSVDGTSSDVASTDGVDALNRGLYPGDAVAHGLVFQRNGVPLTRTLSAARITRDPVPLGQVLPLSDGGQAGYLLFNDHNLPSEARLIDTIAAFRAAGVRELVLDLRYNSGGYLFIANELATMIAGTARTSGQTFETRRYNARRSAENETELFRSTACQPSGNRCTGTQALPTLNLSRVYVLAQSGTCSASEAIINGLRGVNVDVVLIGGKTCGKPYGFVGQDNCGISYFPMEFAGANAKGFSDYSDGFVPGTGASARFVAGCTVADDFGYGLGDTREAMLAAALRHAATGQCPVSTGLSAPVKVQASAAGEGAAALQLPRHPARSNRIWLGPY